MADIAAGDVTYTFQDNGWGTYGCKNIVKLTFGNGSLYYKTATKVPLTIAKLGCPNAVKKMSILEGSVTTGYVWEVDHSSLATTTPVMKGFYANNDGGADGPLIEIADTVQPAAQEVWVEVEGY